MAFFAIDNDFNIRFTRHFFACHERNLIPYSFPLLRDIHKNDSSEEFDKHIKRYAKILDACDVELNKAGTIKKSTFEKVDTWVLTNLSEGLTAKLSEKIEYAPQDDIF
ncbi:MAG: hypothetical protein KAS32_07165 [Candidatus Peribacteraceae bacterium]|nr:hypothetical protein [Candidatus Peribacteraceae bacterium]